MERLSSWGSSDPIQPFWVLNSKTYYKRISDIQAIAHFYKFDGADGISTSCAVPDGAIDIIIECGTDRLNARICGPVNHGSISGFEEGHTYFGIRLRTESLCHVGDAPVRDLVGHEYALDDLLHDRSVLERIAEEENFGRQASLFEQSFLKSGDSLHDGGSAWHLSRQIILEIYRANGMIRISDLESRLHYSRRHLARCFSQTMGMDIKTFSKYVRFQYILRGIRDGRFEKASDAAMAGNYYDQSHFQKDFRQFTNLTPYSMIRLFRESDYASRITLLE